MKKIIFLVLFITSFQAFSQQWGLVWQEEFNYTGAPDNNFWSFDIGGGGFGNQELQFYTDRQENARVENGNLVIEAKKEIFEGNNYTSSKLMTRNKVDWRYGRLEVRAMLPHGRGIWPAIWLLPTESKFGNWPSSGEIDVMEYVGYEPGKVHFNIHTEAYNHSKGTNKGASTTLNSPETQFYTYILEWYPDSLVFKVNDLTTFVYEKESNDYRVWPYDEHFFLILNTAVGGTWGGAQGVDDNIFPQEFLIDYVRFYKWQESSGPYTVSTSVIGGGEIQVSPMINDYADSTIVTLTAVPDLGYKFLRWRGDLIGSSESISFPVRQNVSVSAEFVDVSELVVNGDFTDGATSWNVNAGSSSNSYSSANGEICVNINDPLANPWDIAISQAGINLEQGKEYVLNFSAYATEPRSIHAGVGMSVDPWATYYYPQIIISNKRESFTRSFTMNSASDENARVIFDIGGSAGSVCVDNISIQEATITGKKKNSKPCSLSISPKGSTLSCLETIKELKVIGLDGKEIKTFNDPKASTVSLQELKSLGAALIVLLFDNGESQVIKSF